MPGDPPQLNAFQRSLPTLDKLQVKLPGEVDGLSIARKWFQEFSQRIEARDVNGVLDLFLPTGLWRDNLALTWEFRTFEGVDFIKVFLKDRLDATKLGNLKLNETYASFEQPYPDLAWVQALFDFETDIGRGKGVFRLVPTASGDWKAYTVYTTLEELKAFPEQTGIHRNFRPNHGLWPQQRRKEISFEDSEPTVVIIGAGQSGLEVGARLKLLGVPTLIVERNARVGDQWRGRYEALCLHDPVWYDHMPYIPFPSSWPVWTPAPKLADWLESYAQSMELNVWLSTTIHKIDQGGKDNGWIVKVTKPDGTSRDLKPKHIVFAHGFGGGVANMPVYPGQDKFKGKIIHSTKYRTAREHVGKKVVIIGACTSGHDIALDHYYHGVDVTMYQRSSTYVMSNKEGMPRLMGAHYWEGAPPTDVADLMFHGFPNHVMRLIHQRVTRDIAEADKDLLDGLKKRGFRVNFGDDGCGFLMKAYERAGGYYLDVGASQMIVDGKIKLKNDSQISYFSEDSIVFEDGSTLPADVIIYATGYGNQKALAENLCGKEVADRINQIWGLNDEGELNSVWRWSGVPNLYFMSGNLALCRYFSKHLSLYIKANEEGLVKDSYSK